MSPGAARGQAPGQGTPRGGGANPSPASVFGPGTGASAPMPPTPPLPQSIVPLPQRGDGATAAAPPDPVYAGKNVFIDKNSLVVFRLTEHWNARKPDPRAVGLATAMGWMKYKTGEDALRAQNRIAHMRHYMRTRLLAVPRLKFLSSPS